MTSSPRLLLDAGNTRCKWVLNDGAAPARRGADALDAMPGALGSLPVGTEVLVASVASAELNDALQARLEAAGATVWFARTRADLDGLSNSYTDPSRMGVDRWLAMLGALQQARGERFCVIDAGSALTIDMVAADGRHEGGYIIPGAALMQRALFADTDRVRFDADVEVSLAPGRSTAEAVIHGITLAQVGAVRAALKQAASQGSAPVVFLCGGGADSLAPFLPGDVLQESDLVLQGLLRQARVEGVVDPT